MSEANNGNSEETISMKLDISSSIGTENWNRSEVHKQTRDTFVSPSQKGVIDRMNKTTVKKAEQQRDRNNQELQKKIDYYK
nr:hypothetical protein [Flavobacterium sp. ASV13]